MNKQQFDDGGPAFPLTQDDFHNRHNGMSLRDWFAGMALQGYNSNREQCANMTHDQAANNAYRDADAMIAARNKQP